jgi:hypothetical protein
VKGIYHDIIEGKRGRLLLGRRRLDIEAYNGLTELPTLEQITPTTSRLTIIPTEGTEPDILSPLTEEEDFPSVLQIFEAIEQATDEPDKERSPSPVTDTEQSNQSNSNNEATLAMSTHTSTVAFTGTIPAPRARSWSFSKTSNVPNPGGGPPTPHQEEAAEEPHNLHHLYNLRKQ